MMLLLSSSSLCSFVFVFVLVVVVVEMKIATVRDVLVVVRGVDRYQKQEDRIFLSATQFIEHNVQP